MRFKSYILATILTLFLLQVISLSTSAYADISSINNVEYSQGNRTTEIRIHYDKKVNYKHGKINEPLDEEVQHRIYVDMTPAKLERSVSDIIVDDGTVDKIRVGQHTGDMSRIVIDLKNNVDYEIKFNNDMKSIVVALNTNEIKNNDKSQKENITQVATDDNSDSADLKIEEQGDKYDSDDEEEDDDNKNVGNKNNEIFDPDSSPPLAIKATDKLSLGGKINFDFEWLENTEDLDKGDNDTITTLQSEFSVAGLYTLTPSIDIFAEGRLSNLQVLEDEPDEEDEDTRFRLRRGYVYWRDFLKENYDIRVGRQRFKDRREWLYDDNLDAVKFYYNPEPFELQLSVSSQLIDGKRDKDKTLNYIVYGDYEYAKKQKIALFSVIRQDRNGSSEDRFFFGGSWRGRPFSRHNLTYLNTAVSIQRDDTLEFTQGFGIDGGITKRFSAFWRPSITLTGAFGSKNFRQTGLQDNNGKFNGKTKFKYYGVVLNPELANLLVGTVGFGLIPREQTRTSIDLVYHYYSQISAMDELVDADVKEDPEGDSKDIGHELDLVFGTNITKWIKFSVSGGVFFPGTAYDNDDNAYFTEIELQIAFK